MSFGDIVSTIPAQVAVGYPVIISEITPPTPTPGTAWFKPSTSEFKIFANGVWVIASGSTGTGLPSAKSVGDILIANGAKQWVAEPKIDNGRY